MSRPSRRVRPRWIPIYRALLFLYPPSFRHRFQEQMVEDARELVCGEDPHAFPSLRVLLRLSRDLLRSVPHEWLLVLREYRSEGGASQDERAARSWHGRELSRASVLMTFGDDLWLAMRAITHHRGIFLLAAVTLALGVGATTAVYSALKAVVLDPLPFPEPERLVKLQATMATRGFSATFALQPGQLEALREERDVFAAIEDYNAGTSVLTSFDEPERVQALRMTEGLPALLGLRPVLGRTFVADEVAGDGTRVVLLSHGLWRSRYGGRADVLGRTMHLDGEPWTIIGVMPRDAVRPDGNPQPVDVWLPLPERSRIGASVARLAPGVTVAAAAARADEVVRRGDAGRFGGAVAPVQKPDSLSVHLRVLMIAVTLLLLVACVNVSNLLLQRAWVRARETAVRSALGASRGRLVHQFLLESAILAAAGGALGAVVAHGGLRALLAFRPEQLEMLRHVRIDGDVLLFCLAVAALAGLLFGILPALQGSRTDATAALGRAGRYAHRRSGRFRLTLVAAEVALSFALLVGAALVVGSLRELSRRDPGFRIDGLVSLSVALPAWSYEQAAARTAAFESLRDAVARLPAAESVVLTDGVPPSAGSARIGRVQVEGREREDESSLFEAFQAEPTFLGTLGLSLVAGRPFTRDDAVSAENPVILGASAARRLFPADDAVGRRFGIEGDTYHTVVGIARDIRTGGPSEPAGHMPVIYFPLTGARERMHLVVRAERIDAQLLLDLRQIVRGVEPDALVEVATVRELFGATLTRERFTASLLAAFATLTLLLVAVGLYGVLSQVVVARTREIGVRMALGADAGRIGRLVLGSGLAATAIGLALGAALAVAGLRVLRSEIFGLGEPQVAAYLAATAVLLAVSLVAMLVPARRAVRLDPMRAIRVD